MELQLLCFQLSVVATCEELGNPFMEESGDLLAVDTKDIMNSDVVETVKNVVKIGQAQYIHHL